MNQLDKRRRDFLKSGGFAVASVLAGETAAAPIAQAEPVPSASMPTPNLRKTGHRVHLFSLGGQAKLQQNHNEAVAIPIVERALDLGVNYIDTSSIYGGPERLSERYIGRS